MEVAARTVTAAVVGSITFAVILISSAIFLYVRYKDNELVATVP